MSTEKTAPIKTEKKVPAVAPTLTEVLEHADNTKKLTNGTGDQIRLFDAAEKQIPRYRRKTLKEVLPAPYWNRISWCEEPDIFGDPDEEFHAAWMVYSTVSIVIDGGETHPYLREAETSERVLLTLFNQPRRAPKGT